MLSGTRNLSSDSDRDWVNSLDDEFDSFPIVTEGESKIVRLAAPGTVIVRLKPTVFSFSAGRTGIVEGTDQLRLDISRILWQRLIDNGIGVSVRAVGDRAYVGDLVEAPPIEVIVKASHIGTPKHLYRGMEQFKTRFGTAILPEALHEPYVRFDWRNPLPEKDECMPAWLAHQYIDTTRAEETALHSFDVLRTTLRDFGIELLDICFFVTTDGRSVYGELSPDCMRAKHLDADLDKDLWRKGKDPVELVQKWTLFRDLIAAPAL